MTRSHLLIMTLTALSLACGDSEDPSNEEPAFDLPQILPNTTVLCLSFEDTPVGPGTRRYARTVQLTNAGRQDLVIESVEIEDPLRPATFEVDGVRDEESNDCPVGQCRVETNRDAFVRFFYTPTELGWDAAFIRVRSNAQNFPNLRVFVLATAIPPPPEDGEEPQTYDPGPKPAIAQDADGNESCPDVADD